MDITIRMARADDQGPIEAFTTDTFEWGDYVHESWLRWLATPNLNLLVAVDNDDTPIATSAARMLSATEGWLQGTRVRPDWRRIGVAQALAEHQRIWVRDAGGQVLRLCVEAENRPARAQVESDGYRPDCTWIEGSGPAVSTRPVPATNGGSRTKVNAPLSRAATADAVPALMSWSSGDLYRAARAMFAVDWTWRRLTEGDLVAAAEQGALWTGPTGWAIAAANGNDLEVAWMETRPEDANDFVRGLLAIASEEHATRVKIVAPDLPWVRSAFEKPGLNIAGLVVYGKPL